MYTEIHIDISYFNRDTKQSNVTCQNAKKNTNLSVALTSVQLKSAEVVPILFCDCCNAARRPFHCKIRNNVSKIILSCLGSMCTAWCIVLHEHKVTRLELLRKQ